jgi:hypothetical protein
MARSKLRKRPDGIHEIVRRGKAPLLLVGATLLIAALLLTVATAALAVRVALAVPFLLGGGLFAVRQVRRPGRSGGDAGARRPGGTLRLIGGGLRVKAGDPAMPAVTSHGPSHPARDAGA